MNVFAIVVDVRIWGASEVRAVSQVQKRLAALCDRDSIVRYTIKRAEHRGGRLRSNYDVYAVIEASSRGALHAALIAEFGELAAVGFEVITRVREVTADLSAVA